LSGSALVNTANVVSEDKGPAGMAKDFRRGGAAEHGDTRLWEIWNLYPFL
jgi:hypothetical protein